MVALGVDGVRAEENEEEDERHRPWIGQPEDADIDVAAARQW